MDNQLSVAHVIDQLPATPIPRARVVRRVRWWALLAVAVGSALVVGSNQASVTFFWSPYRMDVSLNLFLLVSALVFVLLHLAWRAVGGLFELPREARRWRMRQQERAMHGSLLMAQTQLMAGRYIRARTLALAAIEHERI